MNRKFKQPNQLDFPNHGNRDYLSTEDEYLSQLQKAAYDEEILKGKRQDRKERKLYANLTFTLISIWLMLIIVIFVGIGKGSLGYSDSVVIALLTTTTAGVIALFAIVAKYLFPSK